MPERDWNKVSVTVLLSFLDIAVQYDSEIGQGGTWDDLLESGLCGQEKVSFYFDVDDLDKFKPELYPDLTVYGNLDHVFSARGTFDSVAALAADPNICTVYQP